VERWTGMLTMAPKAKDRIENGLKGNEKVMMFEDNT